MMRKERIKTSRIIFEQCYSKVFHLIEYDLYSKDIKLKKVNLYGTKIVQIFEESSMYYYPSLKIYAERLRDAKDENFRALWLYFSRRFDIEYDRVCRAINIPIRTRVYRISRKHYENNKHFFYIYAFSGKDAWIDIISIVIPLILLIIMLVF